MRRKRVFLSLFEVLNASRLLLFISSCIVAFMLWLVITVPIELEEQALFGLITFILALIMSRFNNRYIAVFLIVLSILVSSRYLYWRVTESIAFESTLQIFLAGGLLAAEFYAFAILLLGYFQTVWPLDRLPEKLPEDRSLWPTVDVYIPTYNEPLDVVKASIVAAADIDWPDEKLNVYVLDDGRRDEFARFCAEVGVHHLTRADNKHAKAGNINAALPRTNGEFVVIFDCDHVPVRTFLKVTMGVMLKDKNMAVVQTPHHFFTPDPFERNLGLFRKVPNEGELFYGLMQPGNDFWNAAFFCGSCAVIRRHMLEEIGGIATDTVTEDAHTALLLHSKGYDSAYIGIPQAAGMATESISAHVGQRTRWARGMAQIFRRDNPLFKRGLHFAQRLCYFNAMFHFFYGLPRLVFLTAPLAYLFLDVHIINASALMIAVYVIPHLIHALITNANMQGRFRHAFWAEVYETIMSPYLLIPTTLALISPKIGSFNVTSKGGRIEKTYFDGKIALPLVILILLNLTGALYGCWRLYMGDAPLDTMVFNLVWISYNLLILGAAASVCVELKQVREFPRIPVSIKAMIHFANGRSMKSETVDVSEGGLALTMPDGVNFTLGEETGVSLFANNTEYRFNGKLIFAGGGRCSVRFDDLSPERYRELIAVLFGRPNAWVHWADERIEDHPLRSLRLLVRTAFSGLFGILRAVFR